MALGNKSSTTTTFIKWRFWGVTKAAEKKLEKCHSKGQIEREMGTKHSKVAMEVERAVKREIEDKRKIKIRSKNILCNRKTVGLQGSDDWNCR